MRQRKQAMWQKRLTKGTSVISLFTVVSLSCKILMRMILTAFLTIVSGWLKNFMVTERSGKCMALALVKNLMVSAFNYSASVFMNAINISTNSSS